ncbi:triosephosphate isomerase [Kroppenstedtia guangzhouensis]|uniref:Triosephosphate isomerase n=1 Tax=Kroppenstedtia guangzhouensis TaxID=1274356 RepID=A0ABQ1GJE6_9BACL|nr:triose-phosphate isomerase [Kroppenstedtia guangzhouensis]GGA44808.1 triosephosphate isomerase [Kroppenstedtia guangzhouensis]
MRTSVIAGNWKMYKTVAEALEFFSRVKLADNRDRVETVVCAPFVTLPALVKEAKESGIRIGAQNMHWEEEGAYTGEISPSMLTALAVTHVIIGHSERRAYFAETDETVRLKTRSALDHQLTPIVCVGETLEEREAGRTRELVREQVVAAIQGLSSREVCHLILAYEPVWAIGTGRSATAEDATDVIRFIRKSVADQFDQQVANQVRILYGGSVKPDNIETFLQSGEIDGALVGGASLDSDSFARLVEAAARRGDLG